MGEDGQLDFKDELGPATPRPFTISLSRQPTLHHHSSDMSRDQNTMTASYPQGSSPVLSHVGKATSFQLPTGLAGCLILPV